MEKKTIGEVLTGNAYPGRGILIGKHADADEMIVAYFIMGRSENSRNRVFAKDGDGIRTEAFDPTKLTDPSLIIYHPVRMLELAGRQCLIVTNGDQTDTVYEGMLSGKSFADALRLRTFEPDAPNYTPRISGMTDGEGYQLSILKSADGNPDSVQRFFYEYAQPIAGQGHLIHTYRCDGDPLPSFSGEPVAVLLKGSLQEIAQMIWDSLNEENRISLFVRSIPADGKKGTTLIYNKNQRKGE